MKKNGVTLIELMVVMMIIAVIATFIVPNYFLSLAKTRAQSAENNLYAIAAAQQKYYEINGIYCVSAGCNANLTGNLRLVGFSSADPYLSTYFCTSAGVVSPVLYKCSASDASNGNTPTLTMTVQPSGATIACTPAFYQGCP